MHWYFSTASAGLAGVVAGWLLSQKEAAPVPEVAFKETPTNILATGRAREILKFGAPKEGVSGSLVYENHVAYDSPGCLGGWQSTSAERLQTKIRR